MFKKPRKEKRLAVFFCSRCENGPSRTPVPTKVVLRINRVNELTPFKTQKRVKRLIPRRGRRPRRPAMSNTQNLNKATVCHPERKMTDWFIISKSLYVKYFSSCFPFLFFPTSFCPRLIFFRHFFKKTLYFFIILCYHMG